MFFDESTMARAAATFCSGCPERGPCLRFALEENIKTGVWGGLLPGQRAALQQAG